MKGLVWSVVLTVCAVCWFNASVLADGSTEFTEIAYEEPSIDVDFDEFEEQPRIIEDNAESYNRAMFNFNDKLYFYVIKPANKGYKKVVPEKAQSSVRKMFLNIGMPGRFLNCLFQGKFKGAGGEMARFLINSSLGVAGMFDPALKLFNLSMHEEDFGQTLAKYGMDNGSYLVWPGIGPSSVRDTVGFVGDLAMNPLTWVSLFVTPFASAGRPTDTFNDFALDEGELYESIVKGSLDPYIAIQDAYVQKRNKQIEE